MSKRVWVIFQARNNDHWFGSNGEGVYRYDGKTVTRFTTKDGLPHDQIRDIQEDKSGNIYIQTVEGISKFDGHTFTTLTPVETDEWKAEPNDLWFKFGPYRFDGKSLHQLTFPKHSLEDELAAKSPNPKSSPYSVYTIYKDRNGSLWFGTADRGACRYDGKTLSWLYEDHLTNTPNGGSFGIRSIIEDKAGKFWICNTNYRYDVEAGGAAANGAVRYQREPGGANLKDSDGDVLYFMSVVEDKGALWMATYGVGVWRYDGDKVTHYPVTDGGEPTTVFSIYKDHQGALWLGTHTAGAYKFNGKTFEPFRP